MVTLQFCTPNFYNTFSTANPYYKPFLPAPNTPVSPFQSQGKVWVRVSPRKRTWYRIHNTCSLLGNPQIATRLITQCYLNSKNAWIEEVILRKVQ